MKPTSSLLTETSILAIVNIRFHPRIVPFSAFSSHHFSLESSNRATFIFFVTRTTTWSLILLSFLIISVGSEAATVYATAKAAGLDILVAAIDAAGMKGVFNHPLRGTVFAPTDKAFAELIAALGTTADELLANKALLRTVLKYHVVFGKPIKSSDIPKKPVTVYTWDGLPLKAKSWGVPPAKTGVNIFYGKGLKDKARVVAPDVAASGPAIIHVINKVMVPPS